MFRIIDAEQSCQRLSAPDEPRFYPRHRATLYLPDFFNGKTKQFKQNNALPLGGRQPAESTVEQCDIGAAVGRCIPVVQVFRMPFLDQFKYATTPFAAFVQPARSCKYIAEERLPVPDSLEPLVCYDNRITHEVACFVRISRHEPGKAVQPVVNRFVQGKKLFLLFAFCHR